MDDQLRRNMALFPMSIVRELTGLTARQIRYYEENHLVSPQRTEGNRRMYSFNDVDRLLEIKSLLEKGVNLAGIKHVFDNKAPAAISTLPPKQEEKDLSDEALMKMLKQELLIAGKQGKTSLIQGELSRFFH
ncbi:MerR family transcriptional regulator [Pullulanibacillus sp. KACC 23026]|uniref:MerR family transcriptional regulator n=1 Tax=Pullulanibacillus sp. KACC 23026 TaxID=3028315 RepID=UPI0023B190AE|nr:MerR family transcriptional regulator [Pullulanibacillus sp. KACC 23026]WEG11537.1 MerR family transcriptional regulator [Pullulanibacillus sp. KACC 23026]